VMGDRHVHFSLHHIQTKFTYEPILGMLKENYQFERDMMRFQPTTAARGRKRQKGIYCNFHNRANIVITLQPSLLKSV